jgi:hypothetical protein
MRDINFTFVESSLQGGGDSIEGLGNGKIKEKHKAKPAANDDTRESIVSLQNMTEP